MFFNQLAVHFIRHFSMITELSHPNLQFHFTEAIHGAGALLPEELPLMSGFARERVASFCAGRYCARKCLSRYGYTDFPVLMKPSGAPLWPDGFTGSISHSKSLAGAIVARKCDFLSVGLDIEEAGRLQPDVWPLLFTRAEQAFLHQQADQPHIATIFFSIKEAFYKLRSAFASGFVDFTDVEVTKDGNAYSIRSLNGAECFLDSGASFPAFISNFGANVVSYLAVSAG